MFDHIQSFIRICTQLRHYSTQRIMENFKTFVFFDLETTGLPFLENNTTKITELSVTAVLAEHLKKERNPRVQNRLTLCFNPGKLIDLESEKITGLNNFLLEHAPAFTDKTVSCLNNFLEHSQAPICLVAHNGNRFDYPILRRAVMKTGTELSMDVYCIDSLLAFQELHRLEEQKKLLGQCKQSSDPEALNIAFDFDNDDLLVERATVRNPQVTSIDVTDHKTYSDGTDILDESLKRRLGIQKINETTPPKQKKVVFSHVTTPNKRSRTNLFDQPSFKLVDIYKRLVSSEYHNAHFAAADVSMLVQCAAAVGEEFINWANSHAKKFCDIAPMTPGKRM